jgi:hypothetical protein
MVLTLMILEFELCICEMENIMDNFLLEVTYDPVYNSYLACYADGQVIQLGAVTYHDAILEADNLDPAEYSN